MGRISLLAGLLLMQGLLVGCNRQLDQETKVSFNLSQFQKNSALAAGDQIKFVAVNVSGTGMERKVFVFDAHDQCVGNCVVEPTVPSRVELDVPAGSGRLIQVLLIVKTTDAAGQKSEEFRYGETRRDLTSGDNPIQISVSAIAGSTNKDGSAGGRYLLADGTAFTGPMSLQFTPPTGSPNMEIFKLEMFNGWFNLHLLDNIDLTYKLGNGHIMFGGPIRQSSTVFDGSNNSVQKIVIPARFEQRSGGTVESRPSEMMSIGFWKNGQPEAGKIVCRDSTAHSFESAFLNADLTGIIDWPSDFTVSGPATCTMTDPAVSLAQMSVDGKILEYGGGDGRMFRGPYLNFKDTNGYYNTMETSHDGSNTLTVSWKYLPGVLTNGVAGSTVFLKVLSGGGENNNFGEGGNGLDCGRLAGEGFSAVQVSGGTQTVNLSVASASLSQAKVIICPRKADGTHFKTTIESHCLGSCGGGGGGAPTATKLAFKNTYTYINNAACIPLDIEAQTASNSVGSLPTTPGSPYAVDLTHTLGGGNGDFYSDVDCTSTITSGDFNMFGSHARVYFKGTVNSPANLSVASDAGETTSLTSGTLPISVQSAAAADHWAVISPSTVFITECTPFLIQLQDAANMPVAAGTSYTFSGVGGTNGNVYSGSDCLSTTTGFGFSSPKTQREFFYKPITTGAANISATEGTFGFNTFPLSAQDPGPAQYAKLEGPGSTVAASCTEYKITTFVPSASGQSPRANVSSSKTYALATDDPNGYFYPGPSSTTCAGDSGNTGVGSTTSVSQAAATYEVIVYYKTTSVSGSFNLSIDEVDNEFDDSKLVNATP